MEACDQQTSRNAVTRDAVGDGLEEGKKRWTSRSRLIGDGKEWQVWRRGVKNGEQMRSDFNEIGKAMDALADLTRPAAPGLLMRLMVMGVLMKGRNQGLGDDCAHKNKAQTKPNRKK